MASKPEPAGGPGDGSSNPGTSSRAGIGPYPLVRKTLGAVRLLVKSLTRRRRKRTPPIILVRSLRRRGSDRKVDVVIAGVQKGGTTALHHFVRQHPEICTSRRKEVHYFDKQFSDRSGKPNYHRYHAWFDPEPSHKILLEATPVYIFKAVCVERMSAYNPEMKAIVILRNPIDRTYSHWQMETRQRRERNSFAEVLARYQRERPYPSNRAEPNTYFGRGFYVGQIERLWRHFPREQTLILRNEDLLHDRDATMNRVFEFAGVAPFECANIPRRPSVYEPMSASNRSYLKELFEPEIHQLETLLGWDCSEWLAQGQLPLAERISPAPGR
jgi:hypothetical protein